MYPTLKYSATSIFAKKFKICFKKKFFCRLSKIKRTHIHKKNNQKKDNQKKDKKKTTRTKNEH